MERPNARKNIPKDPPSQSPWQDMYGKIAAECPENEAEREVLRMLGAGRDLLDCLDYWKSRGLAEEGFSDLMKRADRWETAYCETGKMEGGLADWDHPRAL